MTCVTGCSGFYVLQRASVFVTVFVAMFVAVCVVACVGKRGVRDLCHGGFGTRARRLPGVFEHTATHTSSHTAAHCSTLQQLQALASSDLSLHSLDVS